VFGAATETFSRKNINCSIGESLERFAPVVAAAKARGIRVRGYISVVAGCPYEGEVRRRQVASLAGELYGMGCYEVSLGDTIGVGTPKKDPRGDRGGRAQGPDGEDRRALPRHLRPGARQHLRLARAGGKDLRQLGCGAGRLPLRQGGHGQRRLRGRGLHARRPGIDTGIDLHKLFRAGSSSAASSAASPLRASPGRSPPSSIRECGFPGRRRRFALHQRVQDEPGDGVVRGLPPHARRDRRLVGDERGEKRAVLAQLPKRGSRPEAAPGHPGPRARLALRQTTSCCSRRTPRSSIRATARTRSRPSRSSSTPFRGGLSSAS